MTAERIIGEILSRRPEISREDILQRLEKEKGKTGGLISDETLLRMVAAEFGVEIPQEEAPAPTLSIGDLVPSLGDVTVVGRVIAVFPSKTFEGVKSGKFASLFIADESDILRVVLWNDKASIIESGEVKVGQIIRFSHGYTREDRGGRVELHIGDKGEIEINPKEIEVKDYPTIRKFTTKIGEITQPHKNKKVNVVGTVKELFPASAFRRQDSSSGKVMRIILSDETGEIPVVVWNEKVDELERTLRRGVELQIVHAKVKKAVSEGLEIHVDGGTYVEKLATSEEFFKIAIFELKDETGRIWVSAWRRHADSVKDLKVGDKIIVKNVYVKKGFGDQVELSTRNMTSIILFSKNEKKVQN